MRGKGVGLPLSSSLLESIRRKLGKLSGRILKSSRGIYSWIMVGKNSLYHLWDGVKEMKLARVQ